MLHDLREEDYDLLHDSQVVENRQESAEKDDRRQHLKCEKHSGDGARPDGILNDRIRRRRTKPRQIFLQRQHATIARFRPDGSENEKSPFLTEVQQRVEDIVKAQKESGAWRPRKHEDRKRELKPKPPEDDTPGKSLAVFRERPGQKDENEDAKE